MARNEFISQQVSKIVEDERFDFPLNMAMAAAWIIANFKGVDIKIFDTKGISSLSDYYVLATAQNPTQARAMIDTIEVELKHNSCPSISVEGMDDCEWILLDHGDVMVHIFQEEIRQVYDLDVLWARHSQVGIPQEFYFQVPEGQEKTKVAVVEERNYF